MKQLFISPHDDDQALFGAFTCIRNKPDVLVVLDSYIQPNRGEKNCDHFMRNTETHHANEILGCKTLRCGLRDDTATEEDIEKALRAYTHYDIVYAPDLQGGNVHHDMISRVARKVFGPKVLYYSTYTKNQLWTTGDVEITPTPEELNLKNAALDCYKSQLVINLPHFQAVFGRSEWLSRKTSKVFVLTQFGSPHEWTEEYLKNVAQLGQFGWYWKIFTTNKYENVPSNVEIVDMDTDQFNDLVTEKLGVRPHLFVTPNGVPSQHVTDFYPFTGLIFEDYLRGYDFWGITNIDIVYGRLDRFVSDEEISDCDVWTDDVAVINGIFSLYRNRKEVNELCLLIPDWQMKITKGPCPRCVGTGRKHELFGTDEYDMTEVMKTAPVRYKYPKYHPIHSHDRLEQHMPLVKLEIRDDGSLWELFEDMHAPEWAYARAMLGKEIPYFHFIRTKEWPTCLRVQ